MGAPKKPNPLGPAPKPGFAHDKFPTIGKLHPDVTYRSQIDTARPFADPAFRSMVLGAAGRAFVPGHLRVADQVLTSVAGSSSGDQSRDAFARAMNDKTRAALNQSMEEFDAKYQSQAEKSQADDTLAQRQNAQDETKSSNLFDIFNTDVLTGFDQRVKDLAAYYVREKKNADAQVTAAALRFVGGFLGFI